MYILNITTNITNQAEKQWLRWMQETFIPSMLATKKFSKALITQVMVKEEMGGVTYSTQYFANSKQKVEAYYADDHEKISSQHNEFKGMYVDFSTELKVVNQFFENVN